MFKDLQVAVVGATGAVGQVMLELLSARGLPADHVTAMASHRSAGKKIPYGDEELRVVEARPKAFDGIDIALVSAIDEVSRELIPQIVEQGCLVIDDSAIWRMDPEVPLVVPEINGNDVEWSRGILSIPNCATTPLVMALWPLHRVNPVKRVIVATYQSVSGTGAAAMAELDAQNRDILDGKVPMVEQYPHQIAFNVLPQVDAFLDSGYTVEEQKIVDETRKIMHEPEIAISATCVRVPVRVSHSEAVHVELERPMSPDEARELLAAFPGVTVVDDPTSSAYPMPINATGKDDVFVGRVRQDISCPNGLVLWVVSDNLRKGAATNAVQIAEMVVVH